MTVYSSTFPLRLVASVWDLFLCEGWIVVYRTLLSLLDHMQQELLPRNAEQITSFIRSFQHNVDVESIMEWSSMIPLNQHHIQQYAAEFRQLLERGEIQVTDLFKASNFISNSDATADVCPSIAEGMAEGEDMDAPGLKPAAVPQEQQVQQQETIEETHFDVTLPSFQCNEDGAPNLPCDGSSYATSGITEEEAIEIWMGRPQREQQQALLQGLQQGMQRRSPFPMSDHADYLDEEDEADDRPLEVPASQTHHSATWNAALGEYNPAYHDAYVAYQRYMDGNRPGLAEACVLSTPGLARLIEQQRQEDIVGRRPETGAGGPRDETEGGHGRPWLLDNGRRSTIISSRPIQPTSSSRTPHAAAASAGIPLLGGGG